MGFDPMTIARPASDESFRNLLARVDSLEGALAERSAMISQITATRGSRTISPWAPAESSFADAVSLTLSAPEWATSAIVSGAGHVQPAFSTLAGSPYVYARIRVTTSATNGVWTEYSEPFFSWLGAADVPAALSWPFHVAGLSTSAIEVAVQAYSSPGAAVEGGSVSVAAVIEWMR